VSNEQGRKKWLHLAVEGGFIGEQTHLFVEVPAPVVEPSSVWRARCLRAQSFVSQAAINIGADVVKFVLHNV